MSMTNEQIMVVMARCHKTRTGLPYVDELLEEARTAMGLLLTENKRLLELDNFGSRDQGRYRWLRERLMAADFDWQDSGECALVFAWPKDCAVSGNCDATIDAAMLKTQNG